MFIVRFHSVYEGNIKINDIPLENFPFGNIPHNVVFVTVRDIDDNVRFIFIVKDRANIRNIKNTSVDFIVIFGENWSDFVECSKAKACIMDFYMIGTALKILKDTRSTIYKKYAKRIESFAEKKGIPYIDYCGTIPTRGHG